jgi:hypothetical protein
VADPWTKYQTQAAPSQEGPWARYGSSSAPSVQSAPRQAQPSRQPRPRAADFTGNPREQILGAASGASVTSGYRTPEHNQRVGGATNSYHTRGTGQALDLVPGPGETMAQLHARLRQSGLPFQELLNEGDHVHAAWNGPGLGDEIPQAPNPVPMEAANTVGQDTMLASPGLEGATRETAIDLGRLYADNVPLLKKGSWVRNGDEVFQLQGDAYTDNTRASDEALSGNAYLRRPNLTDQTGAFVSAAAEQVPFLDEAAVGAQAVLNGEDYSTARDRYRGNVELLNQTDRGARNLGGIAGFGLGLAAPGAGWVNSAQGASRIGRAAALGAGYGALFGAGNTEGSLSDRLRAAGVQAGLGAGGGALLQQGADALGTVAGALRTNPSAARQLSQAGVDLTPGQMLGGSAQRIEDSLTSVPFLGDSIRTAQRRGLETFNAAAINRALEPVGAVQGVGRQGLQEADLVISGAYDNALSGVTVPRDATFDAELSTIGRTNPLPDDLQGSFNALIGDLTRRFGQSVDGQTYKQLDSELGAAVRSAQSGSATDPAKRLLAGKLQDTRDALQGAFERANPQAYAATRAADTAAAGMSRIRGAATRQGTAAREGLFTAGDLNAAVRMGDSSAGRRSYGRGEAMLQDLSDAAAQVLPATVPDSGTAIRSLFTVAPALAAGGGAGAVGVPLAAPAAVVAGAGLFGGSALYGKGIQGLINRAYRASTPGAAQQALSEIQAAAARTPVLQPLYEALQSRLLPLLRGEPTATQTTQ